MSIKLRIIWFRYSLRSPVLLHGLFLKYGREAYIWPSTNSTILEHEELSLVLKQYYVMHSGVENRFYCCQYCYRVTLHVFKTFRHSLSEIVPWMWIRSPFSAHIPEFSHKWELHRAELFLKMWQSRPQEIFCLLWNRKSTTVFKRTWYWTLVWARWTHSTLQYHLSSISALILSYYLHPSLSSSLLPSPFLTKVIYMAAP